jgi:UDP-N-acetylmuramate: L-alanyl-gamma-D-glutamyl-meso-diaminopimelate ligase
MIRHIHLIAICGTAMGTLAGMLKARGFHVTGSDQNIYPPMSEMLAQWEIPILKGFQAENLNPKPDLVIVGNAVSKTNPEVEALLASGIRYLSLPQALSEFFLEEKKSLVVAGTHGKTTTTILLSWILYALGLDPSFLVGGISKNFNASYRLGEGEYFVIEGDEYDTAFFDKGPKFWHYRPYQAILTGVEFDHADIYRDLEHLTGSFRRFVELIPPEGKLFLCGDNENVMKLIPHAQCPIITYGLGSSCEVHAEKISFSSAGVKFELIEKNKNLGEFRSPLPGRHNLQNLLGVLALILRAPSPSTGEGWGEGDNAHLNHLQNAVSKFQGVKRRQEIKGIAKGITIIDDFAHHPTAVAETIDAIRTQYPTQKIWAIFEPRSNTSRRAVFQKDYAQALAHADEIVIAKVFMPEKVKNAPLLDETKLAQEIALQGKPVIHDLEVDEIVSYVTARAKKGDVLLVMSNGGFGGIHQKLLERLA